MKVFDKVKVIAGRVSSFFGAYKKYLKANKVYFGMIIITFLLSVVTFFDGSVGGGLFFTFVFLVALIMGLLDANEKF